MIVHLFLIHDFYSYQNDKVFYKTHILFFNGWHKIIGRDDRVGGAMGKQLLPYLQPINCYIVKDFIHPMFKIKKRLKNRIN